MKYVSLGRTGLQVSRICLGCMSYGDPTRLPHPWSLDEEKSRPFFRQALEGGINFFDTANAYSGGSSEEITGRALNDMAERDEIVVATKAFFSWRNAPNTGFLSRKALFKAVDDSLKRLGMDYIDLYQIHRFDHSTPVEETMEALHDIVKSGKVRYIGASSMPAWRFAKMQHVAELNGWTRFVSMQPQYNLIYREEEREMLPLCADQGVGVIPWSPLARGKLTRDWQEQTNRSQNDVFGQKLYKDTEHQDQEVAKVVASVAQKRGVPRAQIALAWLLAKPEITSPIIGATKPEHLSDAISSLDVTLSNEEMKELESKYVPHLVTGIDTPPTDHACNNRTTKIITTLNHPHLENILSSAPYFVVYSEDVESKKPDEDEDIQKIEEAFSHVQHKTEQKHHHAMRTVHSKSHGILKGTMSVYGALPEYLRQGVFGQPKNYEIMLRFSTSPGDIAPDSIGGVQGIGLKMIGVEGEKILPEMADATTQDFLFANHPTFPAKDSKSFLIQAQVLDKVVSNLPESIQIAQNTVIRAGGEVARHLGFDPIGTAVGTAKKITNILGNTFYTGVPLRYGKYIAKLSLSPVSENLKGLINADVDLSDENALRDIVVNFFKNNSAEYELRVQLCKDLEAMPIEDPSVRWSEDESPYIGVAKITLPAQNAWGSARQEYGEDVLSFNPWHSLVLHRPLGSIMRTRRAVYEASSKFRHSKSGKSRVEPRSASEMPD